MQRDNGLIIFTWWVHRQIFDINLHVPPLYLATNNDVQRNLTLQLEPCAGPVATADISWAPPPPIFVDRRAAAAAADNSSARRRCHADMFNCFVAFFHVFT